MKESKSYVKARTAHGTSMRQLVLSQNRVDKTLDALHAALIFRNVAKKKYRKTAKALQKFGF